MKFVSDKKTISDLMNLVGDCVEKKNTMPILANVVLALNNSVLQATATDLDIEVSATTMVDAVESGATSVDAFKFRSIIGKMPAGKEITFELVGNDFEVTCGRSKFSLATLSIDEFPRLTFGTQTAEFTMDASAFSSMLDSVKWAASTEEARYYLNGVYMHTEGGTLIAVATNGHVLAKSTRAVDGLDLAGLIVPSKTVNSLKFQNASNFKVSMNDQKIKFAYDGFTMVSKLIDGTFPEYQRVIPDIDDDLVTFDAGEMSTAIGRVASVVEKGRGIKFEYGSDGITLSASDATDKAVDFVPCQYEGPETSVIMNHKYITSALACVKDTASLQGSGISPVVVTDTQNDSWLAVVVPMRG